MAESAGPGRLLALGIGLMVAVAPAAVSPQTGVSLVISGDQGASFHGRCTITGPEGQETLDLIGTAPYRYDFAATGLSCQIAAWGGIRIDVFKGGGSMFWTVRNGTVSVNIS